VSPLKQFKLCSFRNPKSFDYHIRQVGGNILHISHKNVHSMLNAVTICIYIILILLWYYITDPINVRVRNISVVDEQIRRMSRS
jgi:hypothetical protein